jgi:hypothetical protein
MGYVPLNNYKYDSGYRRIQTGPDNQGFIVLTSGQSAYGANEGIVVAGSPLSGTIAAGAWDYDSNWRYVPGVLPGQSGSLDPTPYNTSGAILDTYKGTRIATRTQVAGAQAADAIGPEENVVQPRQAPLQPRASVTQPEKYMYFGGAAPDNQGYSPYNTPDANTPAEGRTGGPVTHRNYENTLLTNVFGTQGTSDRSQWRYHQPVYCKTYTETIRSQSPGLMSTPLRYIYRGNSTQYNENYGRAIRFTETETIKREPIIPPFEIYSWLLYIKPIEGTDQINPLDSPLYPSIANDSGTSNTTVTGTILLNNPSDPIWSDSDYRNHLWAVGGNDYPLTFRYLESGGATYTTTEAAVGIEGTDRTFQWVGEILNYTPGPGLYRYVPMQRQIENKYVGFTGEWDFYTEDSTTDFELFFNIAQWSSIDINYYSDAYVFFYQYDDVFAYQLNASRNIFEPDEERYFKFGDIESRFIIKTNEWNRFSITQNNELGVLYVHINGEYLVELETSTTIFPEISNEYVIEYWCSNTRNNTNLRLSNMRFTEYPLYTNDNYIVRSMFKSPYPLT